LESEEEEVLEYIKNEAVKFKSSWALADFFGGIRF
jgi:hypothetical protein